MKFKLPERKLREDSNNDLVKNKIKVLVSFKNKQIEEIKKYRYVNIETTATSVLDCNNEINNEDDIILCKFKEEELKKLYLLRDKYNKYYNKYGC